MSDQVWNVRDKLCLVTGANSGLGEATAVALARQGASVVIVCRTRERGEAALAAIRNGGGTDRVDLLTCDFSSQRQIRDLASEFKRRYQRLDVLVNNAGAMMRYRTMTEDGIETTFGVNHLGYFLLTHLLLDVLKASAPARIVNVASEAHQNTRIDFDDLYGEKEYKSFRAYGRSKLANILFTYQLAQRLEGSGVTVNCLHPGVVGTGIARNMPFPINVAFRMLFMSPAKGARTTVYLASSPEVQGVSGKYFINQKEVTSSPVSYDVGMAARLWEVSEKLTGLAP